MIRGLRCATGEAEEDPRSPQQSLSSAEDGPSTRPAGVDDDIQDAAGVGGVVEEAVEHVVDDAEL